MHKFDYKMATNNSGGDVGGNKTGAELDKLLYSYMELHERLDEAMKKLEDAQREGYIRMSQARVSMGQRALCSLQYDPPKQARVTVECTKAGLDTSFIIHSEAWNKTAKNNKKQGSDDGSVRRRTNAQSNKSGGDGGDAGQSTEHNDKPPKDPITWFGMLVPGSLRLSQASFKRVVQLIGEVASIRCQLELTRKAYEAKQKSKIVA
eukprot:m.57622 g.57622  ORF g.57622 m.57622 type:complete len:206 (-) comp11120_c0_seq1:1176-1793(-)